MMGWGGYGGWGGFGFSEIDISPYRGYDSWVCIDLGIHKKEFFTD